MFAPEPERRRLPFSRRELDPRAVGVVARLQRAGHETYFVGGCVRDLLLRGQPKDYDIATAARPEQVRSLFRRARVIGRRFQLVHVYDGREVYEVSTFRRDPSDGNGEVRVIRSDNTFGSAREDAQRRDFTVNGLFLDPVAGAIVDWVGGLADVDARLLRSIGDPERRFREDPVRILRLIKFMRRLGLEPGSPEVAAAYRYAPHLVQAAPPRVAEEVFRLLGSGDAAGVLEDLLALRALPLVLPDLGPWLEADRPRVSALTERLRRLDAMVIEHERISYGLRLAFLYSVRAESVIGVGRPASGAADTRGRLDELFRSFQQRGRLPRYDLDRAKWILHAQARLAEGPGTRDPSHFIGHEGFPEALEYFRCRLECHDGDLSIYDQWREVALPLQEHQR